LFLGVCDLLRYFGKGDRQIAPVRRPGQRRGRSDLRQSLIRVGDVVQALGKRISESGDAPTEVGGRPVRL